MAETDRLRLRKKLAETERQRQGQAGGDSKKQAGRDRQTDTETKTGRDRETCRLYLFLFPQKIFSVMSPVAKFIVPEWGIELTPA